MADEHSEPGGMKVLRLYADALGESRFETTTMPMALKEFAPPAAPLCVSDPQPAQNYVILEVGAKWGGAVPHPSPARMMAFSLSGCTRVTASSGESHTFVAMRGQDSKAQISRPVLRQGGRRSSARLPSQRQWTASFALG